MFPKVTVDRRAELIEAGISLLAQQQFQDLLAAVETRTVVDEVGVTTGSFFHHFRNRSHFAAAVADSYISQWTARVARLAGAATSANERQGLAGLRPAASEEWAGLVADGSLPALQHLLWGVRSRALSDETARTAGDMLRQGYDALTETVEATYMEGLRLMGREMLPPFTSHDCTVIMTAFAEGLQMRHGVDPDAVRDDLYADTISAILLGITRPLVQPSDVAAAPVLTDLESRFLVHHHNGRLEGGAPAETWRHIADSAAHLFIDRSPGEVRESEVAAAAGVSLEAVHSHFVTVTAVAAAGWARHLPELEAIAAVPTTQEEGPIRRIEQVLLRAVELVRANRGAAEALIAQVIVEAAPSSGTERRRSIRDVVPAPRILVPLISELRTSGQLRRRMETERLARSVVHLCTMQSLVFADQSAERIVDEVMTLVFDGALVAPSDA